MCDTNIALKPQPPTSFFLLSFLPMTVEEVSVLLSVISSFLLHAYFIFHPLSALPIQTSRKKEHIVFLLISFIVHSLTHSPQCQAFPLNCSSQSKEHQVYSDSSKVLNVIFLSHSAVCYTVDFFISLKVLSSLLASVMPCSPEFPYLGALSLFSICL